MRREEWGDLAAFMAVAEARSFTKAAGQLGTSQSALSHTVRRVEARLGLRLLTRTTRSVAPTEAGERLLETLRPAFEDIEARLSALTELREKPAGTIRITAGEHAAIVVLWPVIETLLRDYPDIKIDLSCDQGLTDLAAGRFDAGVRLGEQLAQDMIAVRIGPELRMALVCSPDYLAQNSAPLTPHDLSAHQCINLRLPTLGGFYAWEFEKDGREVKARVDGQLAFNHAPMILKAAEAGYGLAYLLEDQSREAVEEGRLVRVMEDWCPPFPGYHLYYPSRRQPTPAFSLLVEALRYRGP